jgi:similar to stage IV sporulation protein
VLPTGGTLPLTIVTDVYYEYIPHMSALSVSDAERILRESLLQSLYREVGQSEVISAEFTTEVENGVVTVTMKAECIEQIAAARDFTEEELWEARMMPPTE